MSSEVKIRSKSLVTLGVLDTRRHLVRGPVFMLTVDKRRDYITPTLYRSLVASCA